MMHDDIDRLLAGEDEITPSPGFLSSVMEAVEREAAAPRALEFPWSRALPGILATIAALAASVWQGIAALGDPAAAAAFDEQLRELTALATGVGLQWIVLAVAITILCARLPIDLMRMGNRAR